ncbi:MAG: tRNA preQ1(34) S-adenosylmethionine ribosyltransferase-isomerase QueA [Candidatus Dormibacteria bacterium]
MTGPDLVATPTADFDYPLPPEAIAQQPLADRSSSRMLVLGEQAPPRERSVSDLPEVLAAGDCLVVNDTRVRRSRLRGRLGEGSAEVLLLGQDAPGRQLALVRPARRLQPGTTVTGEGWRAKVLALWPGHPGGRVVALEAEPGVDLELVGEPPLPPYIHRALPDPERYQTVYAQGRPVSAAAPTAGLHVTQSLLTDLARVGVGLARVQLEVGLATFAPIRAQTVEAHRMHEERISISTAAAAAIRLCRERGGRVVAVGTTVVRCLESLPDGQGGVRAGSCETGLYLRPGCGFSVVDGLLTNFHQPRSSLLVLVCAFFGRDRALGAYREALERGYRFLSFGDCMFGWRLG